MKTTLTNIAAIVGVALGLIFCGNPARGDTAAPAPKEKNLKGMIASVDPQANTVSVKYFLGTKRFNVANDCKVSLQDKPQASLSDLRQGQKVEIGYEVVQGVMVAHYLSQLDMTVSGYIHAIDPAKHTLNVREGMTDKTLRIPDDCQVMLKDNKSGELSDIRVGSHVTVTYEVPDDIATAREIAQSSTTFTGALRAVDLDERTLRAKGFMQSKKFNLGSHCTIVLNDKPEARLNDLALGGSFVFTYDEVNGVNIVNRIAPAGTAPEEPTVSSTDSMVPVSHNH